MSCIFADMQKLISYKINVQFEVIIISNGLTRLKLIYKDMI